MSTLDRIKMQHSNRLQHPCPRTMFVRVDSETGKTRPLTPVELNYAADPKKSAPLIKISDIVKDELSAMSYIDKKGCPHSYDNDEELEIMGIDIVTDPRIDPLEIIDFAHENSRSYKKVVKTFEEKSASYNAEIADATETANEG